MMTEGHNCSGLTNLQNLSINIYVSILHSHTHTIYIYIYIYVCVFYIMRIYWYQIGVPLEQQSMMILMERKILINISSYFQFEWLKNDIQYKLYGQLLY